MKIEFIKPVKGARGSNRITLQKKGRLNFSLGAREELSIKVEDYFKVGTDKDNDKRILYLLKVGDKDQDAVKINKSGESFFLSVGFALPLINVDNQKKKYRINYSVVEHDNKKFIKLEFEEK